MYTRNEFGIYLPSLARVDHALTGVVKFNTQYKGILIYINVTAFTGTSITYTLADSADGDVYTTVLVGPALSGTGQVRMQVYPGVAVTANASIPWVLGRRWKITGTGTITTVTSEITHVLIP